MAAKCRALVYRSYQFLPSPPVHAMSDPHNDSASQIDLEIAEMGLQSSDAGARLPTGASRFDHDYRGESAFSATKSSHFHATQKINQGADNLSGYNALSLLPRGDRFAGYNSQSHRPVTIEEVEGVFARLTKIFRFQKDNSKNMLDFYLLLLDSRASRMECETALRTLHADYIGGPKSNFRKWYFATEMYNDPEPTIGKKVTYESALATWGSTMATLSAIDCVIQVALYLLCWGEANNIRFMPEGVCFIFKCCNDFYYSPELETAIIQDDFLDHIITPLYRFYRDQSTERSGKTFYASDKDHKEKLGYDDMNQLFWYKGGIDRLVVSKNTKLMKLNPQERYAQFNNIVWKKAFYKIFLETRSWAHAWANFTRIWIIHLSMFWYYITYNSPTLYVLNYRQSLDNQPTLQATFAVMSLAGTLSPLICLLSSAVELQLVSMKWPGNYKVFVRILLLMLLLFCNLIPTLFLFVYYPLNVQTTNGTIVATLLLLLSMFTSLYLAIVPQANLFYVSHQCNHEMITGNYHSLEGLDRATSYGIWLAIFGSKFIESYFYIAFTAREPIRILSTMAEERCAGDQLIGKFLCQNHSKLLLGMVYAVDLTLFFIDTYLWYILWSCAFSIFRSFQVGVSIWTPWRNIFSRLPKRIQSNILASSNLKKDTNKYAVSQIWNSIVIAMYREHLISIEQVQALVYKSFPGAPEEILTPQFFDLYEDGSSQTFMFDGHSEAERRITFFAQSLSTPMRPACVIQSMPSFCCLIPHFEEKTILSLKEIITELDRYSHVTMLEYLKLLHPKEWISFVRDTKMLAEEFDSESSDNSIDKIERNLPYESVGFKIASPEYILRTRIWASLRTQTLYRTISGFMNYSRAIKLVYDLENDSNQFPDEFLKVEAACAMALRKFRLVVSMQKLQTFDKEESDNKELLLRIYPELQIAYLEESIDPVNGTKTYYSALIDGACHILANGERKPRYRIKLSGNPILGDGKSDNQNHAIIFTRGEYIQLVDANQDNYIEECLKIRSVLAEFEEMQPPADIYNFEQRVHPVAIIGTREYIFSENIGILGDIAAGKEQTFGTLFARTLARIEGKLHYGHPDFLNSVFMLTRGGVSKAQRGLHLNEDIYAGINAVARGGRIKHCEYMQCGKGRDLGFGSILSFTTKIGTGMAEQMLSREYFSLGSTLPLDRFLSFYYAHPGFHLNNMFIMVSILLFSIFAASLAAYSRQVKFCDHSSHTPITDPLLPRGCKNLHPVVIWLESKIWLIFVMSLAAFFPLGVQELTERGFVKAVKRIGKHIASLSPLFEVFVNQTYASSLVGDISHGGARYLSTGRGFATARATFASSYSRYALTSYFSGVTLMALISFSTLKMWTPIITYFWFIAFALLICPSLYNPHQFAWVEFHNDYRKFLAWMFNHSATEVDRSWYWFTKESRCKLTGIKKNIEDGNSQDKNKLRPSRKATAATQILFDLCQLFLVSTSYLAANAQFDVHGAEPSHALLRLVIFCYAPIAINLGLCLAFLVASIVFGPLMTAIFHSFPRVASSALHLASVITYVLCFEIFWFLQNWDFANTLIGVVCMAHVQKITFRIITSFLSKELPHGRTNIAWWSGKWVNAKLGWRIFTQPFRELVVKTMESSYFVAEMVIGHLILYVQLPFLFIPLVDVWHTFMLFWLRPKDQLRPRLLSRVQRKRRSFHHKLLLFLLCLSTCFFILVFSVPEIINSLDYDVDMWLPECVESILQPYTISDARRGYKRGHRTNHN